MTVNRIFAVIIVVSVALALPVACAQEGEPVPDYTSANVTGALVEADMLQKKVLKYYEDKYGYNSVETLGYIDALAWMNMELENFKEAERYYLRVVKIREEKLPPSADNTKELAVAYFMLADSYLYREYFPEADAYYDKSMRLAIDPAHMGDVLSRKGIVYEGLKNYARAIEFYLDAVRKYDTARNRSPQNRQIINARMLIAYAALIDLYNRTEQPEKAREYSDLKTILERTINR